MPLSLSGTNAYLFPEGIYERIWSGDSFNLVYSTHLLGQVVNLTRILSYMIGTKKNMGLPKSCKGIAR